MTENIQSFNVYCDESCYMEHDEHRKMVLGALWCPTGEVPRIAEELRRIKALHRVSPNFELKWTKVSPAKVDLYRDVLALFTEEPSLRFRSVVIPDKALLDHAWFMQTHDTWFYKMYDILLRELFTRGSKLRIFLDYKDTHGGEKVRILGRCLSHQAHDAGAREPYIQIVRSEETQLIPLADLLVGAVSYANRGGESAAKWALVDFLRRRVGATLTQTTNRRETKCNILVWRARCATELPDAF